MGSSSDLCADSTPIGVFLLPDDSLLAGTDTDPPIASKSPEAFYALSQYRTEESSLSYFPRESNPFLWHRQ